MFDHGDILDGLNEQQQRAGHCRLRRHRRGPAQVPPVVGPIRVQVDGALGSLWDG